ncbi:hypothetical protein Zm00014a_038360 [Zea mays]|uniref:F-box/LRR-repeat protein 15-like leucin rich repeat domain-containing protein n=1 Tax=Zea mays TaxID=4577 RepID=A0A3L6EEX2_MAIZE|nr:hypothetical protein Zm00014a_038360 [Zea mays]
MEVTIAEKKPWAVGDGGGLVERLPEALLVEVLARVDVDGLCPVERNPQQDSRGNGMVRSLTVNCSLLDDSAASVIARGSLRDLLLLKCSFSMSFFVALGGACHDLRSLKLEMAVCPYTLYPCLAPVYVGCVHLETLWVKFPLLDPLTTFRSYKALPSAPPSQLLPSKFTASLFPTWLCRPSVGSGGNNNEHSSGMAASCLKSSRPNTIVLSGLSGSGKTTIYYQKDKVKPVHVIDVPGHARLKPKLDEVLPKVVAVVFVVDAQDFLSSMQAAAE